uniref:Uncharacterized protein n=1 Tax=Bracon brevicornis TaxID=1563983 RepID=A0A6V7L6P4_9HYME
MGMSNMVSFTISNSSGNYSIQEDDYYVMKEVLTMQHSYEYYNHGEHSQINTTVVTRRGRHYYAENSSPYHIGHSEDYYFEHGGGFYVVLVVTLVQVSPDVYTDSADNYGCDPYAAISIVITIGVVLRI